MRTSMLYAMRRAEGEDGHGGCDDGLRKSSDTSSFRPFMERGRERKGGRVRKGGREGGRERERGRKGGREGGRERERMPTSALCAVHL